MIKSTQDYDMFTKHPANGPINTHHAKKIKNSIIARNMLDLRPILVNSKMQVIDGQHRLQAAKELGVWTWFF